jgi:hypothetical protein
VLGQPGQLRQVLADAQTRDARGDLAELATVRMARLQVERVQLTWPAVHPQQDAMPAAARVGGQLIGQDRQPAAGACAQATEDGGAEDVAAGKWRHVARVDFGFSIGRLRIASTAQAILGCTRLAALAATVFSVVSASTEIHRHFQMR